MHKRLLEVAEQLPGFILEGRILRRKQAVALLAARHVLEEAFALSDKMRAEGKKAYEAERQAGHKKGLDEGLQEAAAEHARVIEATIEHYRMLEEHASQVVVSALSRIVKDMPREEQIYQAVAKAVEEYREDATLALHVNTQDYDAALHAVKRLHQGLGTDSMIQVRTQSDIAPGRALLQSNLGIVDISLESQISILEKTLSKVHPQRVRMPTEGAPVPGGPVEEAGDEEIAREAGSE